MTIGTGIATAGIACAIAAVLIFGPSDISTGVYEFLGLVAVLFLLGIMAG